MCLRFPLLRQKTNRLRISVRSLAVTALVEDLWRAEFRRAALTYVPTYIYIYIYIYIILWLKHNKKRYVPGCGCAIHGNKFHLRVAGMCLRFDILRHQDSGWLADIVDWTSPSGSSNDNQQFSEVASRCQRPQQELLIIW